MSYESVCWSANRQFLLSDQIGSTADGIDNQLVISLWDRQRKIYRLIRLRSSGQTTDAVMTVDGPHNSIVSYREVSGRIARCEESIVWLSKEEYQFRTECLDGEDRWTYVEGKSRKLDRLPKRAVVPSKVR